eukprot:CAMPEP_0174756600 /NCGR_PEP_ID=MMETSP1094-20130205/106838_1 /TAXON_ID=156173 /ORGANISM="Chrysochromulina brevifilum, Strain UTEX LB 985" /LENGTH=213 /DNA_ID=CAMNT_0015962509 /DNA_START=124 /DNA_END=766 /DNA_ORIENTATION=-
MIGNLLLLVGSTCAARVASLSGHDSTAWVSTSPCQGSAANATACNLKVYEAAASSAASLNADVVLFPEAYGLAQITDSFEPFMSPLGAQPCSSANALAPQQRTLACAAARNNITIAASVFARFANGTKRILELVYNSRGVVIASYSKWVLVPVAETHFAEAGPFAPTTFELAGMRWGIVICYEGIYPEMPWGAQCLPLNPLLSVKGYESMALD